LPKKEYTPKELQEFDGKEGKRILMGVGGNVYDVSMGRNFYGPGEYSYT
jgi:membrane-associated progesterone receptor component